VVTGAVRTVGEVGDHSAAESADDEARRREGDD
jgi:hypothetical protein